MQVHGYQYLQDCSRPFSSCKLVVNSGQINKGQFDNFMKCLKLDEMSEVSSSVHNFFKRTNIGCKKKGF